MVHFKQVRELVQWVADYHAHLKGLYTAKAAASDVGERLKMSLSYVAEHEESLRSELEQYLAEDSVHKGVLDTWFEEAVDAPDAPLLEKSPDTLALHSVQDVLDNTLASHHMLQALFTQRAEHAVAGTESELFTSLANQYEAELRRLVRNMQRLEDY